MDDQAIVRRRASIPVSIPVVSIQIVHFRPFLCSFQVADGEAGSSQSARQRLDSLDSTANLPSDCRPAPRTAVPPPRRPPPIHLGGICPWHLPPRPDAQQSAQFVACPGALISAAQFVACPTEIIGHLVDTSITSQSSSDRITTISSADMGCGRGYLTFSLHSFLSKKYSDHKPSQLSSKKMPPLPIDPFK